MEDNQYQVAAKIKKPEAGMVGPSSSGDKEDLTSGHSNAKLELPEVTQINTLLCMDGFLQQTGRPQTKEFYLKLLARKQKFMNFIRDGKVTAESYRQILQKKFKEPSNNEEIAKKIKLQLRLTLKFKSIQDWFEKLVIKSQKSLISQLAIFPQTKDRLLHAQNTQPIKVVVANKQKVEAVRNQQPVQPKSQQSLKQPQQIPSQPVANSAATELVKKQREMITKIDKATPLNKAERLLKDLAKIESLLQYYKQNLLQYKTKEIKEELSPKIDMGLKIVHALLMGKDIKIGSFVLNQLPKVDFERFHGCSHKQYRSNIQTLCQEFNRLEREEREFRKKFGRSNRNNKTSMRNSQMLKAYAEDQEYLNSIKTKDFVPIPSVKVDLEERDSLVENTKLQKNDLQILIIKVEGINGTAELKMYFEDLNNPKVFEINEGVCSIDHLLKIKEDVLKEITKKVVKIKIETKKMLGFNSVLDIEISLKGLTDDNSIDGVFESKNIKITYQINMRTSQNPITKTRIITKTLKRYPQYVHTAEFQTNYLSKFIKQQKIIEPIVKSPQKLPQPQKPQQTVTINQKQPAQTATLPLFYAERTNNSITQMESIIVQGFNQDNIIRPEIYSSCLSYLTKMDEILDKAMNKTYTVKINKSIIQDLQDEIMKKSMALEKNKKQGKLTNEIYTQMLQSNIRNDQVLMDTFRTQDLKNIADFLMARIQMTTQELNMLLPQQQDMQKKPSASHQQQSQAPQQQSTKQQPGPTCESQATTQQRNNCQGPEVEQHDLTPYLLFFVKRTEQINQALNSVTEPINYVDVNKIINPEIQCYSFKYLTDFDTVLDKAMSLLVGDKISRKMIEQLQDTIMKNKMLMEKKKASMTPEQYKTLVNNCIDQDQNLYEIYKKLNIMPLQQFILARIKLMKLEIGEPPMSIRVKNSFDIYEERELSNIQRTPQSDKALNKFGLELQRPELPQFCMCMTYLEKMIEVSKSPELVKELTVAKDRIEATIGNGEMNEQQYASELKKNKESDIARLNVYKKLDLKEFYFFIKARVKIITSELENF